MANPIDYTSKDYFAYREDMLNQISTRLPEWTSRSPNDFGVVLIELFAYVADNLSFYGDRIANEAYLSTATQRESVLNIARMLAYRPTNAVAATTTLQFTVAAGTGTITIPAGTEVSTVFKIGDTEEPVTFTTDTALSITQNASTPASGTVAATHGVKVIGEALATSTGGENQVYEIPQRPVAEGSVAVYVDQGSGPVRWTYIDNLIDGNEGDLLYTLETDAEGITYVVFGDGINSAIPSISSPITVDYRVGGGAVGNVGSNTLTQMVDSVVGVTTVTNTAAATGGADPESLDQIRENAPKSLRTLERAVTLEDYAALAESQPGVAKANALSSIYTSITLYIAPMGGGVASTSLKNSVLAYINNRKMANATVTLADPTYRAVNITLNVEVLPSYYREPTRLAVIKAVKSLLLFDNVDFGKRMTLNALYAAINKVPGVSYGTVTLHVRGDDANQINKVEDVVINSNEIPVEGTITVTATGGIV